MASAKNKVISGDYEGCQVLSLFGDVSIKGYSINKRNVESYELITEENMKSGSSAVLRGAAGAALLGPVGLLAGLSAKNKGIYLVALFWKNGKKSLIEVDGKIYKTIVKNLF